MICPHCISYMLDHPSVLNYKKCSCGFTKLKELKMDNVIDWNDPKSKVSKYFTVKECTFLPSWQVLHFPSDQEKENIIKHAKIMDDVREFLGNPINIHVWIRPILNNPNSQFHGQDYNNFIKGATNSAHKIGIACDFDCGENCDDTRTKLESKLEEFNLRMEKKPGSNWIHLDSSIVPISGNRYFVP